MDFKDQIKLLGEKAIKTRDQIQSEEATKNAFVMPFIHALGYDIFNPSEVVPEFIADLGIKKGERVDYAILRDGKPIILVECKWCGEDLDVYNSQLFRYFHTTESRFGLLTNGIIYRFYTDLVEPNKMDEKPFLEFSIFDIREPVIEEIKKFHKSYFNVDRVLSAASELKYTNEIKAIMTAELNNPSEPFVKFFGKKIYPKVITEKVLIQLTEIVKKSLHQLINDIINDRLKSAITKEVESTQEKEEILKADELQGADDKQVETTDIEKEGFFIVKSILRKEIDPARIAFRDTLSYFNILLDDTNRKQICRLYLNAQKKYIGLFQDKKETKIEISDIDDIYKHAEALIATLRSYEAPTTAVSV
jgi:predicted type IV restriction endonuclease